MYFNVPFFSTRFGGFIWFHCNICRGCVALYICFALLQWLVNQSPHRKRASINPFQSAVRFLHCLPACMCWRTGMQLLCCCISIRFFLAQSKRTGDNIDNIRGYSTNHCPGRSDIVDSWWLLFSDGCCTTSALCSVTNTKTYRTEPRELCYLFPCCDKTSTSFNLLVDVASLFASLPWSKEVSE